MKSIKWVIWFVFVFFLFSCEKDIDFKMKNQTDKLVLYSFIYPDSVLCLHFSKNQDVLSLSDFREVRNGGFRLYQNDQHVGTYLFPSNKVSCKLDGFTFKPGDYVRIEAYEQDGDTVKALTYIPYSVPIIEKDTVSIEKYSSGDKQSFLQCQLTFKDEAGFADYYQLYIVRESWTEGGDDLNPYSRRTVSYEKTAAVFVQDEQSGSLLKGLDFQGLFNDELIEGSQYKLVVNISRNELAFNYGENKIRITFYLYHHTYDYYSYFRSKILSEGYEGLPVFEPIKIHSNVNGGLGVFSGMSFSSDSIVLIKP